MKYVAFWSICPEDWDKVIEKFRLAMAERAKGSDKFPKVLVENYAIAGQWRGFMLYEDATPEQLANVTLYYRPEVKFEFLPIMEATKVIEIYMKTKK